MCQENLKLTLSIKPFYKICEPIADDEENAFSVTVTTEMSREDVLNKILEMVK